MHKFLALAALAVSLSACATLSTNEWTVAVQSVQTGWPLAEAAIAAEFPTAPAAVTKAEAAVSADVAALSGTTAPTNATTILADVQMLVAALPTQTISAKHQAEIDALLAAAKIIATLASGS